MKHSTEGRHPSSEGRGFSFGTVIVLVCIFGLSVAALMLAWRVRTLRSDLQAQVPSIGPRALDKVLELPLKGCDGRVLSVGTDARDSLLLYVFTPYDCPICQQELLDVETLAEEREDVGVYALMGKADTDASCQTERNFGLTFPVLVDPERKLADILAAPDTPWKILMKRDASGRFRIVWEDPKSSTPDERRAFAYRVRMLLNR